MHLSATHAESMISTEGKMEIHPWLNSTISISYSPWPIIVTES